MSPPVSLVLVHMGGRPCAMRAEHVVEIVPRVRLSEVPNLPPEVLGVVNVRGRVVPVMDVRARVSGNTSLTPHQHLVIVQAGARHVGLAVDEVIDVRDVAPEAVESPGALAGGRGGPGVVRIDEDLVLVVAPEDIVHVGA
ncbi:MAG: chemotaxis protein CheW [Deltaproteobacteria bacterium]|nr:chemotaxis protein CheW [Deltaproteobacteria bacterium]